MAFIGKPDGVRFRIENNPEETRFATDRRVADAKPAHNDVEHPGHYNWMPNGIECKDVAQFLPAMVALALRYQWRAGRKVYPGLSPRESAVKDLLKAVQCLEFEMDRIKEHGP